MDLGDKGVSQEVLEEASFLRAVGAGLSTCHGAASQDGAPTGTAPGGIVSFPLRTGKSRASAI